MVGIGGRSNRESVSWFSFRHEDAERERETGQFVCYRLPTVSFIISFPPPPLPAFHSISFHGNPIPLSNSSPPVFSSFSSLSIYPPLPPPPPLFIFFIYRKYDPSSPRLLVTFTVAVPERKTNISWRRIVIGACTTGTVPLYGSI